MSDKMLFTDCSDWGCEHVQHCRTGRLERHEPVTLKSGSTVVITPRDIAGTPTRISTTFPDLAREASAGARILLRDGLSQWQHLIALLPREIESRAVSGIGQANL